MLRFLPFKRFRAAKLQEAGVSTVPSNVKQKSSSLSSSSKKDLSPSSSNNKKGLQQKDSSVSSMSAEEASKRKKKKTSARLRPRFENLQYMFGSAVVALATIALQHYVRKGWDKFKGNRTERDLMAALAEKLEVRQDWSVALLYSAVRQADRKLFSSSDTIEELTSNNNNQEESSTTAEEKSSKKSSSGEKFGAPFLADPQFETQIDFLDGFLTKLRNEQFPTISMADMWVAATLTALRSLGGPSLNITFGRGSSTKDDNLYNPAEKTYHVAPPLLDVIDNIKFSEQYIKNGFSTPEIVALQGVRSLACHGESSEGQMSRLSSTVDAREKNRAPVELPPAPEKVWGATSCGVLNFFFFQNLLEGQWEEKQGMGVRYVLENDNNTGNEKTSSSWWSSLFGGSDNKNNKVVEEEQNSHDTNNNSTNQKFTKKKIFATWYEDANTPGLCMEPRDLELLEDAYFAGWVHKFGQNEAEFLKVFGESMVKTTQLGWRDTVFNEVAWW